MNLFKELSIFSLFFLNTMTLAFGQISPPPESFSPNPNRDREFLAQVQSVAGRKVDDYVSIAAVSNLDSGIARSVVRVGFFITTKHAADFMTRLSGESVAVNSFFHICTGTIVSSKVAITAAHCNELYLSILRQAPQNKRPEEYGLNYAVQTASLSVINVEAVRDIPNAATAQLDTSFLILAQATQIPPVPIAPANTVINQQSQLRVYGYYFNSPHDGTLQNLDARWDKQLVTAYERLSTWSEGIHKTFSQIQEQDHESLMPAARGRVSCPGSSGGPTVTQIGGVWKIIAVTSGGGSSLQEDCYNATFFDHDTFGLLAMDRAWVGNDFQIDRNQNITFQPWVYETFRQLTATNGRQQ